MLRDSGQFYWASHDRGSKAEVSELCGSLRKEPCQIDSVLDWHCSHMKVNPQACNYCKESVLRLLKGQAVRLQHFRQPRTNA